MGTPEEAANDVWEAVFGGLNRLREQWPAHDWTYDRRLRCVASSIPLSQGAAALAAVGVALPASWSPATLPEAHEDVRALAGTCGGLRASQQLLWGGPPNGPGAFGLWWPWGDGTTVTLRIGLHHLDLPKVRYPRLRDLFGIPQAAGPG
ncbi:MAG TPA: hypothetical protein VHH90_01440 [Polyangia bacterium]|nr:hypothetical protein [Polyangia bacterium]